MLLRWLSPVSNRGLSVFEFFLPAPVAVFSGAAVGNSIARTDRGGSANELLATSAPPSECVRQGISLVSVRRYIGANSRAELLGVDLTERG